MPREQLLSAPTQEYAISKETKTCDLCYGPALALIPRRNSWLCATCLERFPITAREIENRQRVALKLVAVLESIGGNFDTLATMTEADWELAAQAAKVDTPSLETRSVVASMLQRGGFAKAAR